MHFLIKSVRLEKEQFQLPHSPELDRRIEIKSNILMQGLFVKEGKKVLRKKNIPCITPESRVPVDIVAIS